MNLQDYVAEVERTCASRLRQKFEFQQIPGAAYSWRCAQKRIGIEDDAASSIVDEAGEEECVSAAGQESAFEDAGSLKHRGIKCQIELKIVQVGDVGDVDVDGERVANRDRCRRNHANIRRIGKGANRQQQEHDCGKSPSED